MNQIASAIASAQHWLKLILGLALLIAILAILVGVLAKGFGLDPPFVRAISPIELAYLAGAYWLAR